MTIKELQVGQMFCYPDDIKNDLVPRTFMMIGTLKGNLAEVMILNMGIGIALPKHVMYATEEALDKEVIVVDVYADVVAPAMRKLAYPQIT